LWSQAEPARAGFNVRELRPLVLDRPAAETAETVINTDLDEFRHTVV